MHNSIEITSYNLPKRRHHLLALDTINCQKHPRYSTEHLQSIAESLELHCILHIVVYCSILKHILAYYSIL